MQGRSLAASISALALLLPVAGCNSVPGTSTEPSVAAETPLPPPPPPPATQTCPDGSVVVATDPCPVPPPPPPPPPRMGERDDSGECEALALNPPRPSAQPMTLPRTLFGGTGTTLEDVAYKLERARDAAGYAERGFYCVPGGFALATRVERIRASTKAPWPGDARWETSRAPLLRLQGLSLSQIIEALTAADAGRYRMIVFFATDRAVRPTTATPAAEWSDLPSGGDDELPPSLSDVPFGPNHRVRAFVYEFSRPSVARPAMFVSQTLATRTHLERSGILAGLR